MSENPQAQHYAGGYDYWTDSPHLKHRHLYERLTGIVSDQVVAAESHGAGRTVLEVGAGDGNVTERLLAQGFVVTSTEMSPDSIETLARRFGRNAAFRAVYDEGGDLRPLGDERFGVIVFSSVLHHIPDYLAAISGAIERHLLPGGGLVSLQDPLWYPRLSPGVRATTDISYLSWRIFQGEFLAGVKTRLRRAQNGVSEDNVRDVVEYHVVRDGVDEQAISSLLGPWFETVDILRYWSTQGTIQQKFGDLAGIQNTFAVVASNCRRST